MCISNHSDLTRHVENLMATHQLPLFFTEMCTFLLGEGMSPEVSTHVGGHKLRQTLIERCDHLSDEVKECIHVYVNCYRQLHCF